MGETVTDNTPKLQASIPQIKLKKRAPIFHCHVRAHEAVVINLNKEGQQNGQL